MLALNLPSADHAFPERQRRGGIVWQPHYEGFTTVAYRDGRAIAGISGPWSNQYVLIWWQPEQAIREVEVFDSLAEAKLAVAQPAGAEVARHLARIIAALRRDRAPFPPGTWSARCKRWWRGLLLRPGAGPRVRRELEETDLSGLHLRAIR